MCESLTALLVKGFGSCICVYCGRWCSILCHLAKHAFTIYTYGSCGKYMCIVLAERIRLCELWRCSSPRWTGKLVLLTFSPVKWRSTVEEWLWFSRIIIVQRFMLVNLPPMLVRSTVSWRNLVVTRCQWMLGQPNLTDVCFLFKVNICMSTPPYAYTLLYDKDDLIYTSHHNSIYAALPYQPLGARPEKL